MKKNWKTTVIGIGSILTGVGLFFKGDQSAAISSIITGFGLIFAKDYNTDENK